MMFQRAVPKLKRLVAGFPPQRPGFDPISGYVDFVLDRVVLGQVFSKFTLKILIPPTVPYSSDVILGQIVADVPSGPSLTLPPGGKKPLSGLVSVRNLTSCCRFRSTWEDVLSTVM
jgi:hypothetical protein